MSIMEALKKRKEELSRHLTKVVGLAEKSKKELAKEEEIAKVKSEIQTVDEQIAQAQIEEAKAAIAPLESEAVKLVEELKQLQTRTLEIHQRLREIKVQAPGLVPKRQVQTSSKYTVKLRQKVKDKVFAGVTMFQDAPVSVRGRFIGPGLAPVPVMELKEKIREEIVEALPSKVNRLLSEGWELCDGQVWPFNPPEELTDDNSRLEPAFNLAENFPIFG